MSFLFTHRHPFYRSYIFLYSAIYIANWANATEDCNKVRTSGTGTVLFNPTDVYKTCWSQEEIAILTARFILEDVIPDPKTVTIQCNDDIEDLVEYYKVVIETIRSNTKAHKRHILLLALTDLLGGFMHHALLPMARKAYYAGAVDYAYMEKMIQLYEEIKWFLRTNGQGWTKPLVITKEINVPIIDIQQKINANGNDSCCRNVMFFEHEPVKSKKRSAESDKGIYFPLPFFDAKVKPTAIALPLKHFALRNIESKRAAYVVMKYFLAAEQCLKEKNANPGMIKKFENNLYTWIEKDVIPKLDDDKFYSAFGGILRVQNTLKALGATIGNQPCNTDAGEEEVGAIPGVGCSSRRNKLLLTVLLLVIAGWFLIGIFFICYRIKNNKTSSKFDDTKPSKPSKSTSSFSSKWSTVLSKSSSKTEKLPLCKCCESSISEGTTAGVSTTSDYDSEKSRKRERREATSFKPPPKKASQSSPCICPTSDGPAVIDANHSMKVLPSIAEMSEHSLAREKNRNIRRLSFLEESGISSSDGGVQICAPPWAQTKNSIPCPKLSDKSTNFSSSSKSQAIQDSISEPHEKIEQTSKEFSRQETLNTTSHEFEQPLASSSFVQKTLLKDQETSNTSNNILEQTSEESTAKRIKWFKTSKKYSHNDEENPKIKEEPQIKNEQPDNSYYDYHMEACHSSMAGNYDLYHKPDPNKPYIFGYDFQTTTSSELSEDEDD